MNIIPRRGAATLAFSNPSFTGVIKLHPSLRQRIARYRQYNWWSFEAGGQLFGRVESGNVEITTCTGPYAGDQRKRHSYRSSPRKANAAIEMMAKDGLLYLGEWHTHPEPRPTASPMDIDAFNKLCRLSVTRVSFLVLLIEGTEGGRDGTSVYTLGTGNLDKWVPTEVGHK